MSNITNLPRNRFTCANFYNKIRVQHLKKTQYANFQKKIDRNFSDETGLFASVFVIRFVFCTLEKSNISIFKKSVKISVKKPVYSRIGSFMSIFTIIFVFNNSKKRQFANFQEKKSVEFLYENRFTWKLIYLVKFEFDTSKNKILRIFIDIDGRYIVFGRMSKTFVSESSSVKILDLRAANFLIW